jgi:hypothetical protein
LTVLVHPIESQSRGCSLSGVVLLSCERRLRGFVSWTSSVNSMVSESFFKVPFSKMGF